MNYKKIYNQIIDNRKKNPLPEDEYGEWHHIVPRCLGGSDDDTNLVRLSAREHFICHALLAEMYEYGTNEWYKMNHAFMMMKSEGIGQSRYFNSRLYEAKRKDFSEVMSKSQTGKRNSQHGKLWIYNIDKEKSIRIDNNELNKYEELGWNQGRIIDFNLYKKKLYEEKIKKIQKKKEKQRKEEQRFKKYNNLFNKFVNSNCDSIREFVREGHYEKSHVTLTTKFKKYVSEYDPQPNRAYNPR